MDKLGEDTPGFHRDDRGGDPRDDDPAYDVAGSVGYTACARCGYPIYPERDSEHVLDDEVVCIDCWGYAMDLEETMGRRVYMHVVKLGDPNGDT